MTTSLIIIIYQLHYRPFYNKVDRFFEFINEFSLLSVSYCLLATVITDHMYEEKGERFPSLDFSILSIIVLVIDMNFFNFLYCSVRDICKTLISLWSKIDLIWKTLQILQRTKTSQETVAVAPVPIDLSATGNFLLMNR